MHINIRATGMDLTPAITQYIESKIGSLSKFLISEGESVMVDVVVGRTTSHHKAGDIFQTEVNISLPNRLVREVVEGESLYATIDIAKDKLAQNLGAQESKKVTVFRKGARKIKSLLRGWKR